jgi:2-succinyl-5-enolpyruvyl-6-hydroxy-3-cyclohexene-1-carboxylate synthase
MPQQVCNGLRVEEVFLGQHTRRQRIGCVARQDGHDRLRQNRTVIEFGGHLVHRRAGHFAASIECPLVRVQTRKSGQQRGVDIEQAALVALNKSGRENTHKAGQHQQQRLSRIFVTVNQFGQGGVEGFT